MIIQCHECGAQVSTEARACVQCGAPPKRGPEYGAQSTTGSTDCFVSFDDAQYLACCPVCGGSFQVSGKYLAEKPHVKCPYLHVAGQDQKIPIETLKPRLAEGQVIYSRLKDYFSYAGRLSVADYWLSLLPVLPILLIARVFVPFVYPILFFAILQPLWVKRYHDHDMGADWVIIQGVGAVTSVMTIPLLASGAVSPVFAIVYGVVMLFCFVTGIMISCVPGKKKTNRYGPPTSEIKRVWW